MIDVVIAAAARTPVGSFGGIFATVPAHELATFAVIEALGRAKLEGSDIDEVIMGQVLPHGQGQNPARKVAVNSGIPIEKTAIGINQVCGSGLRSVALGFQAIRNGDANIVVAGGMESMTLSPHLLHLRTGTKMGEAKMLDAMVLDALNDTFYGYPMGVTAENIVEKWGLSREEQDAFALMSQNKAEAAQKSGRFKDEIVPVTVKGKRGEVLFDNDESPRHGMTMEALQRLKPVFVKNGTVTAGNASGLNDGAAALVLMSAVEAAHRGITPLARIASWATAGVPPEIMGTGPIPASRKALEKSGWSVGDLDLIEANEAFAAQSIAVNKEMGWDVDKVNVNGGAIAIGHPVGASGARILTTLLYELKRRDARRGLATLCIGGGQGIALCIER